MPPTGQHRSPTRPSRINLTQVDPKRIHQTMRALTTLRALSLLLPMSLTLRAQNPPSPTTLAALRDRYRPLLLFAASPGDPSLLAQMTRLKDHAPGLNERDVLVIAIPFNTPSPTAISLTADDAEAARRRFRVAPTDFAAILLGKDGGEKLRSSKPIAFERLSEKIDSMPMRKNEIRSSHAQ